MKKYYNEDLKNILGLLDCCYIKPENRILPMYVLEKNFKRIATLVSEIEIKLEEIDNILNDSWED